MVLPQPYGDLTKLNSDRLILNAVSAKTLEQLAKSYLGILGTSGAIYERNGDYALGIFSSGWCRMMDSRSRELCETDDNKAALESGKWYCHESCWEVSKDSMEKREPCDIACAGGIRLYAVPIVSDDDVIGSINFGYTSPPTDREQLEELSEKYQLPVIALEKESKLYKSRSDSEIESAKHALRLCANLIGEIVRHKKTERRLLDINQDLRYFAHMASHDLFAPLRAISMYCSQLENELSGSLKALAGKVVESAKRMQQLIDGLLSLCRIDTAKRPKTIVDLNEVCSEVMTLMSEEAEQAGIAMRCRDLPKVKGDRSQLSIVLQNLIGNAIQHGKTDIEIYSDGKKVCVEDKGKGIREEDRRHIFDAFYKGSNRAGGAGLGLAIAKKVIDRHGGKIWCESDPQSTRFSFTLR